MVDRRRVALEHGLDELHPLADRHRRQVQPVGHVTDGVDRRHAGLRVFVHFDRAAAAERHAGLFQAHVLGVGRAAGREQHHVEDAVLPVGALDPHRHAGARFGLGLAVARGLDRAAHVRGVLVGILVAGGGIHAGDVGAGVQVDAAFLHRVGDQAAGLLVEAAQDLRAAVVLRHLDAQPVEDAGEFAGDVAAADDQDGLGQVFQVEDVVRHDAAARPRHLGAHGAPAGGHEDVLGGLHLAGRQLDRVRIAQPRAGVERLDPRGLEHLAVDGLEPVQLLVQVPAEGLPVEGAVLDVPAVTARGVGHVRELGREDHQLLGHAAADHAGAAIAAFLGQRDAGAGLAGGHACGAHAARSAADHEEVVVEFAHRALPYSLRAQVFHSARANATRSAPSRRDRRTGSRRFRRGLR